MTTRQGRQARNRLLTNRIILAVLVVAVLAAIYGLVRVIRPIGLSSASQVGQATRLDVSSGLFGCPAPGTGGTTGGGIAIANLPITAGGGQAAFTRLDPGSAGTAVGSVPRPGQLTVMPVKPAPAVPKRLATVTKMAGGLVPTTPARGGLIISAGGANAQGLDVEQLGPGGQPTARCTPAGSDFWFVGPGAPTLHIYVYLLNTDSQPADVSVGVQTDSGPLLGSQDSGIVVPPHSMIEQSLDKLVHSARAIALHVTTSTGRIVAAVRESVSTTKEGTWLPAAAEPATSQVLPGLPANSGQRMLYLTVPGGSAAQVKISVITSRGTYQPTGGNGINLLGHQTSGESIPSLGGSYGSIQISSSRPVTGVLELSGGPRGSPGTFITGGAAITGQAVVAANTSGKIGTTELVLSAPTKAATVTVMQAIPGSALTGSHGQLVHIPAKASVQVKLSLPKRLDKNPLTALVVIPQAGSGPVYAGRICVIRGSVQTVLPVISSPAQIQLGTVRSSLLAVLGS